MTPLDVIVILTRCVTVKLQKKPATPDRNSANPIHQGDVRLQDEASLHDRACFGHEEVEGDDDLSSCCPLSFEL